MREGGAAGRAWEGGLDAGQHLGVGHYLFKGPGVAIKRHVLDEPHVEWCIPRKRRKVHNLVLVHAAHDHAVYLRWSRGSRCWLMPKVVTR